jgi:hypothetical protein
MIGKLVEDETITVKLRRRGRNCSRGLIFILSGWLSSFLIN